MMPGLSLAMISKIRRIREMKEGLRTGKMVSYCEEVRITDPILFAECINDELKKLGEMVIEEYEQ